MKIDYLSKDVEIEEIGQHFRTGKAKIAAKNQAYIFSLLSKIYSNEIGSIVREITSNCFDAHVKANKRDEPVFVRLYVDDSNSQYIEFVDKGTGISVEMMDDIYMSYGESDKRDSDDFLGAYGLGSKSPFSYSDYFFVITKVNGIEYTYILNSTIEGPEYNCLLEQECNPNENGTIVRVPVKNGDLNLWENEIKSQLQYFKNVFVVGFKTFRNDYKIKKFNTFQIREDIFFENKTKSLHLVIGDVTYPINFQLLGINQINFNAALTFNIGDLEVTPNREEIKYTPKTVEKLKLKLLEFEKEIRSIILSEENLVFNNFNDFLVYDHNFREFKSIIVNNIFSEKFKIELAYSFPFIQNKEIQFKLKLDNSNLFTINSKGISIAFKRSLKCFVSLRTHNYNFCLTKKNASSYFQGSSFFFAKHEDALLKHNFLNRKYIILDENKNKIKNNERNYIIDHVNNLKAIVYWDNKSFFKLLFSKILKSNLKNIDLNNNNLHRIYQLLKEKFIKDIISRDFVFLNDLKIPEKYGQNNKSLKKEKDSILFNLKISDYPYTRKESKDLLNTYPFNDQDSIIFYGSNNSQDVSELNKIFELFNSQNLHKHFSSTKLSIVKTSSKYFEEFAKIPNCIYINEKINTIRKHPLIAKIIESTLKEHSAFIFNNQYDNLPIYLSKNTIDSFKKKFEKFNLKEEFCNLLNNVFVDEKNIFQFDKKAQCYSNFLTFFFSRSEIDEKIKKTISKKLENLLTLRQEFVQDFIFELFYIDNAYYSYSNKEFIIAMKNALLNKEELIKIKYKQLAK